MESPRWSGLLAGRVDPWREWPTLRLNGRTCDPVEGSAAAAVYSPQRGPTAVSCRRDPTLEQEERVESPPPEEEGAAESTCDELTATPIPPYPAQT